jgi:hypothetical protein
MVNMMRIIKEGPGKSCYESVEFFKDHYAELGETKYVILYFAEHEWMVYEDPEIYHQFVIFIGEKAQMWLSGLTWGYYGTGPNCFYTVLHMLDSSITYDDIAGLEWMAEDPIVLEKQNGRFVSAPFDEKIKTMIRRDNRWLPWQKSLKSEV